MTAILFAIGMVSYSVAGLPIPAEVLRTIGLFLAAGGILEIMLWIKWSGR